MRCQVDVNVRILTHARTHTLAYIFRICSHARAQGCDADILQLDVLDLLQSKASTAAPAATSTAAAGAGSAVAAVDDEDEEESDGSDG